MKKKVMALLLGGAMAVSMLAGCGTGGGTTDDTAQSAATGDTADKSAVEEQAPGTDGDVVAFVNLSVSGSVFGPAYGIFEDAVQAAGDTVITDIGATAPEDQITSVQNVISAGAKGIVFVNFTEDCLPKIAAMCEENGVYWAQYDRDVSNPEIQELLAGSEYYCGRTFVDETYVAQRSLEVCKENGITKVAIVGPATGDTSTDTRDNYFQENAADYGIEVVADVRDVTDATAATDAVSNICASHPDVEAIYCISASDSRGEGCISALQSLGLSGGKVKLITVDFMDSMQEALEDGTILCAFGGTYPTAMFSTLQVLNAIEGNSLKENGEPLVATMNYIELHSAQDLDNYYTYCLPDDGSYAYDETALKNLLVSNNPELTTSEFVEAVKAYSLDYIMELKGAK